MKKLIALFLWPLAACQTIVSTPPQDCLAFVPSGWKNPVDGFPLPVDDSLGEWQKFGVGQTGQLTKANERTEDVLHIVGTCERRATEARPRKKFLGIF